VDGHTTTEAGRTVMALLGRYGPGGWSGGFTLAATTYLDEVEPGGGCFYFFPNSHRAVHQFFLRNPVKKRSLLAICV
jgi:hypothetical protein